MALSPDTKERLSIVVDAARFVFQWGFIPTVIYLGKSQKYETLDFDRLN